ncbi:MAG: hypothetical protein PVH77_06700 [Phycisphaerales bacterium]
MARRSKYKKHRTKVKMLFASWMEVRSDLKWSEPKAERKLIRELEDL